MHGSVVCMKAYLFKNFTVYFFNDITKQLGRYRKWLPRCNRHCLLRSLEAGHFIPTTTTYSPDKSVMNIGKRLRASYYLLQDIQSCTPVHIFSRRIASKAGGQPTDKEKRGPSQKVCVVYCSRMLLSQSKPSLQSMGYRNRKSINSLLNTQISHSTHRNPFSKSFNAFVRNSASISTRTRMLTKGRARKTKKGEWRGRNSANDSRQLWC